MSPEEQAHLLARAEQELELAKKAEHPDAVKAHYHLAGFYLDLVYGEGSEVRPPKLASAQPIRPGH